jgi:hypothetical protein
VWFKVPSIIGVKNELGTRVGHSVLSLGNDTVV